MNKRQNEFLQKLIDSMKSNIDVLHEEMCYKGLVIGGAIDYMVEKELWAPLAAYGVYDKVNWLKLREIYINAPLPHRCYRKAF